MVLFLFYVAIHELNMLFGHGELYRLFFRWCSSEAKLARRRRAHLVIRLNGLTEASSVEAISERSSPAYAELVDILCETRFATVAVRKFDSPNGLRHPPLRPRAQLSLEHASPQL
jgi:hypothetical protein